MYLVCYTHARLDASAKAQVICWSPTWLGDSGFGETHCTLACGTALQTVKTVCEAGLRAAEAWAPGQDALRPQAAGLGAGAPANVVDT